MSVKSASIQSGNYLGGSYILNYNNKLTASIPYNASALLLQQLLTPVVGDVVVRRGIVTSEGGASYLMTFEGLVSKGDIPLLVPYYQASLTGVGAVVYVREVVKGSLPSGSSLKVSFDSPLYCSQSQVLQGNCGASVQSYSLQVYTAQNVLSQVLTIPVSYDVQIVRVSATDLERPLYFDGEDATGSFKLTYNGSTTGHINSHITSADLRSVLEALPSIHTVAVSRSYSAQLLQSIVNVYPGAFNLECAVNACDFSLLPPGELIQVENQWYKVADSYNGSPNKLPLATQNDSSVITFYNGSVLTGVPLYRWGRGYEWRVTFLSVEGQGAVAPLTSPVHDLNPLTSTVAIRTPNCIGCTYINNLIVGNQYQVSIQASTVDGAGTVSPASGETLLVIITHICWHCLLMFS